MKSLLQLIIVMLIISACGEAARLEQRDPVLQLEEDRRLINEYIEKRGFTAVDTTSSGVKFAIVDEGDGEPISPDDIVAINYYAKNLDGIVYASNIQAVIDTAVTIPVIESEPIALTYSESGWTFQFVPFISELRGSSILEAMGIGLGKMNTGGRLVIMLPSQEAFGPEEKRWIPSYSVMIYEVYPVEIL